MKSEFTVPSREALAEASAKVNELKALLSGKPASHKVLYISAIPLHDIVHNNETLPAGEAITMLLTTHGFTDYDKQLFPAKPVVCPGSRLVLYAGEEAHRLVLSGDSRFCGMYTGTLKRANLQLVWMSRQVRVVCAAHRIRSLVIPCVRHMDGLLHKVTRRLYRKKGPIPAVKKSTQGFVDNYGCFLTRIQAHLIARLSGQIVPACNLRLQQLYSEDLY